MTTELLGNILVYNDTAGVGYDIDYVLVNGKTLIVADEIYDGDF